MNLPVYKKIRYPGATWEVAGVLMVSQTSGSTSMGPGIIHSCLRMSLLEADAGLIVNALRKMLFEEIES